VVPINYFYFSKQNLGRGWGVGGGFQREGGEYRERKRAAVLRAVSTCVCEGRGVGGGGVGVSEREKGQHRREKELQNA
jgi:hypothetical protein